MKKRMVAAAMICLVLALATPRALAAPQNSAQAAALLEQSTGRVLWQSGGETELPMASTTKVMTTLCVLDNADLSDTVTVDSRMVGVEGSSIYLEEGEELTVEQLLLGLMLRSGNDAATALALHTAGSIEAFADLMNNTAKDLGLEHTHFVNPHGLPASDHYTTAIELGKITCAAYEYPAFRRIVSTKRAVIPWKGHDYDRAMLNKNKILSLYEGGNGVKTGFTKAAGRCLVSGAEREGMQLVCVVLNAPDMWNDSMRILDYGFENFSMQEVVSDLEPVAQLPCAFLEEGVPVLPARSVSLPLKAGEEAWVRLELPENISNAVARGEELGYAIIGVQEEELAKVPLVAGETVQEPQAFGYPQSLKRVLEHWFYPVDNEER